LERSARARVRPRSGGRAAGDGGGGGDDDDEIFKKGFGRSERERRGLVKTSETRPVAVGDGK